MTQKYDLSIEEVDALTGALIGRPNTGTFRLQDLVGLDTGEKVTQFVVNNVKNDSFFESVGKAPEIKFMTFLLENNFLGNKTGKGFYHKTDQKDQNRDCSPSDDGFTAVSHVLPARNQGHNDTQLE